MTNYDNLRSCGKFPVNKEQEAKNGMEYTTVQKTAEKWGVTVAFVYIAAKAGRISGAEQIDGRWYIPEDAENPAKKTMDPKFGYISSVEAAEKWGITCKAVNCAAKEGRIPGAELIGGRWHIPKDVEAPLNRRTARLPGHSSPSKMAQKWGVSQMVVFSALREGRIPGAQQIDGRWHIPEDAENPSKTVKVKAGYISSAEAAKKWGISQKSVGVAAKGGRIPGAEFINGIWHIPENVVAPLNERTDRLPGHVSVSKIAEKWGVSQRSVHKAVKDGYISGAKQIDGIWHIPENAVCPIVPHKNQRKLHK